MSSTGSSPALPPKPKRSPVPIVAGIVVAVLVVVGAVIFFNRGGDDVTTTAAGGAEAQTVKIGVADKAQDYWKPYVELAKSQLNVDVELVNFGDYSLPNPALSQGELDINQFQHIQYLANYNVTADDDLQPIASTAVYPLPLYSTTVDDASAIPQGSVVAIPNDAINEARGLLVLQSAGLITLADGGNAYSTVSDVTSAKVKVTPIDASQTANALLSGSAVAAIVNQNYATDAKLPLDDAIAQDDPSDPTAAPYVNLFAVRAEDKGNETYRKLGELWHDPSVQELFKKANPTAVVVDESAAKLQADLATVEQDARDAA
ncbi:MetQ/NlpA family ABC transporter substrate-binding protein [Kineococcus gynurae]|uniref:MetQ/NlpA family ABC transporter substrate-binding protein n=1 Tax=Kineococcus gynurae TaxID=452979 RepID=A0ABV5LSQ9_9ACTN